MAKTRAEELVNSHFNTGDGLRSSVAVNPGVVIGPVMSKQHTKASAVFLRDCIYGNKVMNFPSTFVDVRDVAIGHVNAMERLPGVKGKRFILANDTPCAITGGLMLGDIASKVLPGYEFKPKPKYPENIMVVARALSKLPIVGGYIMNEYQRVAQCTPIHFDNTAARTVLGVNFRSLDESVKEGIESIVSLGFAKLKAKK